MRPTISPPTPDDASRHEDFSPHAVAGLCVTIGRYWYLFKRLTTVSAGRFYRFEHIATNSSFKALSKQRERLDQSPIDRLAASLYPYTEGQTFEKEERS